MDQPLPSSFLGEEDFTDVTLTTSDDKQIKVHKLIVSSFGEVLKKIFIKNPSQNTVIYLKNVTYKELSWIIHYFYVGGV